MFLTPPIPVQTNLLSSDFNVHNDTKCKIVSYSYLRYLCLESHFEKFAKHKYNNYKNGRPIIGGIFMIEYSQDHELALCKEERSVPRVAISGPCSPHSVIPQDCSSATSQDCEAYVDDRPNEPEPSSVQAGPHDADLFNDYADDITMKNLVGKIDEERENAVKDAQANVGNMPEHDLKRFGRVQVRMRPYETVVQYDLDADVPLLANAEALAKTNEKDPLGIATEAT